MKIHPTAIIHPAAEVADDVEIGPCVCIEGPSVIGPGCILHARAVIAGTVRMGRGNRIGYGAIIGGEPQDRAFNKSIHSEVIIGDHNDIREYCTIHRGTAEGSTTSIGSYNFLMAGAHLGHNTHVGNHVTIANGALLAGHVEVQDHVYIGGGDVFHQFIRIGQYAFTRGGKSGFGKDIPPYTLAAHTNVIISLNSPVLRRAGFSAKDRAELKAAFKLLYKSGLNTGQAIERAAEIKWGKKGRIFFDFVAEAKRRGICDIHHK